MSNLSIPYPFKKIELPAEILNHLDKLGAHDEYTLRHSIRVSSLSTLMAKQLDYNLGEQIKIARGAALHDIGKIFIPPEIINKPGKLTTDEFNMMKSHSESGYRYLEEHGCQDQEVKQIVQYHHERQDGAGYPYRLKLDLGHVQIVALADVYDALVSHRPYRSHSLSSEDALTIIKNGKAGSFPDKYISILEGILKSPLP